MNIGNKIAELRKAKGMTQEQLGRQLGVSAAAVSKWETAASYPDIMLLCPLARALGTSTDVLLEYEDNLSREKVAEYVGRIVKMKQELGPKAAEQELEQVLCRYPNCTELQFHAVALFTTFGLSNEQGTEEDRRRWEQRKKELLTKICESKDTNYLRPATAAMAAMELQDGRLDEAERLLRELPDIPEDTTALWVQLYLKRGKTEDALELLQKRLWTLLCQARAYLTMMIEKIPFEWSETLEICDCYRKLDGVIHDGTGTSDLILAAVYGRGGKEQEAEDCLKAYLESPASPWTDPNPLLFSRILTRINRDPVSEKEQKETMLRCIMADENLAKLCEKKEMEELLQRWIGKQMIS